MKIGVDIDGTIKQTQKIAIELFNEELKQNVKEDDVKEFYLDKAFGLSKKEGSKLWRKLEAKIYTLGIPLANAAETLQELTKIGHEIYFITARPGMKNLRDITEKWLIKHNFPLNNENLFMNAINKGKVAQELNIDLFFEDAPEHLDRLIEYNIDVVIVDAVYNRDYNPKIKRITSWKEAFKLVQDKENSIVKR